MSGAFLAVSFGAAPRDMRPAREALRTLSCDLVGTRHDRWGDAIASHTTLLTWQRSTPIGTTVGIGETGAWMNIGATAATNGPAQPDTTVGVFSTVVADRQHARAWCDDLGYGTIFTWSGADVAAVSTRPELLATLATALGEPPTRDPSVAAELAYIGWLSPHRTGWSEIGALRSGEVALVSDGALSIELDPAIAAWADEPRRDHRRDLLDEIADHLVDNARIAASQEVPVKVDLTAGRDSRLVVAALAAGDALDGAELQTVGGMNLADVRVASTIAAQLRVPHRFGFFYPTSAEPFADRFERHVAITAGVNNVMKGMRETLGQEHHVRIAGQMGEVIRGWPTPVTRDQPACEVLDKIATAFQAQRIDLLRPVGREEGRATFEAEILRHADGGEPGWFAAHRYYAEVRLRARVTRVGDFTSEVRAYPLYSRRLTAASMALLWHDPQVDLADELIERLSPGLDTIDTTPVPPDPAASASPGDPQRPTEKDATFMQVAMAAQAGTRQEYFAKLSNHESRAWEYIDRDAFRDAVAQFPDLPGPQKRLVHGAAGAIVWLGQSPTEATR